jgi:hypothetical protein
MTDHETSALFKPATLYSLSPLKLLEEQGHSLLCCGTLLIVTFTFLATDSLGSNSGPHLSHALTFEQTHNFFNSAAEVAVRNTP